MIKIPLQQVARTTKTVLDIAAISIALCLAFLIRFEGTLTTTFLAVLVFALPIVIFVKTLCLVVFGTGKLTWRYVSLAEAQRLFVSLAFATLVLIGWTSLSHELAGWLWPDGLHRIPVGVLLIDLPLSFLGIAGLRVGSRQWNERKERTGGRAKKPNVRFLLIGAGHAGALVAREMATGRNAGCTVVGFVDEHTHQVGVHIHGLPILGTTDQLADIVKKYGVQQALITMENSTGATIRRMVQLCTACGVPAKIIPEFWEMVEGKFNMGAIRDVAIEDLLRREPVDLDSHAIADVVRDRKVLITGAGGSIGSELCRLVCQYQPAGLILVEQAENNLFFIHRELSEKWPDVDLLPCVADICDANRIRELFSLYRPSIVFHAAAHKHVPMMEWNPGEAIKNNVVGTKILADMAHRFAVREFVMISTDKAVHPSSIMGVSKRVAEIYIQALSQRSKTRFVAVRFGNVLGSAGSVIPIFKEQIAKGGPVTITDSEMKRYFMTIPEACQLVLQAASMGQGGEIFILDMGEPVRIVDLANDLIRLSGLEPNKDIPIHFTGLRPGEKLFEELSLEGENALKTKHPRVFIGRLKSHDLDEVNQRIKELAESARCVDLQRIHAKFKEIVPEYEPNRKQTARQNEIAPTISLASLPVGLDNESLLPTGAQPVLAAAEDSL